MLISILMISHGAFSQGLLESYQMIAGENDRLDALSLDNKGIADFKERLTVTVQDKITQGKLLILCDLKGGTPFNEAYNLYLHYPDKIKVIAGMNLPMVIESGMQVSMTSDLDELYMIALNTGQTSISGIDEETADDEIDF